MAHSETGRVIKESSALTLNQNASSVANIGITASQTKNIHGTESAAVANNDQKVAGAAKRQRQLAMQNQQECLWKNIALKTQILLAALSRGSNEL